MQNSSLNKPLKLKANDVQQLLSNIPASVKTISFDCFDTIIWRKASEPRDVFYELANHPIAKTAGVNATLRTVSEQQTYSYNHISQKHTQASLAEIYKNAFPRYVDEQIQALCKAELETELAYCFAYQPMVELIRALHAKGYKIIIVSDTYFNEAELKTLLSKKLPADVYNQISKIYSSCDYKTPKYKELFNLIMKKENMHPQSILHIGDNDVSDVARPSSLGLYTAHFQQYDQNIAEIIRMQTLASCFVDNSIRTTRSLDIPFKALYAKSDYPDASPEQIGYATIGPILFAYAKYITESYNELIASGRNVKIAYLLRDAYLPSLVCEQITPTLPGKRVRISRFSAFAASFRNRHDIDTYLSTRIQSERYKEICQQLLLDDKTSDKIIKKLKSTKDPIALFSDLIHESNIEKQIFLASEKYRQRLYRYLKNELALESGDTLMFVDLGYTGTTQIRLSDVFKDELNIDIVGRYLISLNTPHSHINKSGLLDATHYDDKALIMLVTYISLVEQICTSTEKSVIDFDENGQPIYAEVSVNDEQLAKIKPIHEGTLKFVADAKQFIEQHPEFINAKSYRDIAALNLTRFIYLPTFFENNYFSSFNHDVNMGTSDLIKLMDVEKGLDSLKRRGWLHSLKETSSESRMNYPSEWRAIALELSILLMSQHRFDFKVAENDLSHQSISLPVLMQSGKDASLINLEAHPSFNGYFSLVIPVPPDGRIGVQFGQLFKCVEIYKIEKIPLRYLNQPNESKYTEEVSDELILSHMQIQHDCLLTAESDQSLLVFNPKHDLTKQWILRILFRPVAWINAINGNTC